jgi:glucose-1-phosphate adenylyltransferase
MGIYIFNRPKLRQYLIADDADPNSRHDFGHNIIPAMIADGEKIWPYHFQGYWRDVGTITSLWDANMDMLSPDLINLYDPNWPISARSPICPPHQTGPHAEISHSIVTEGCEIDGHVENSVLSPNVVVAEDALVSYSVLMPGAVVEKGAVVKYAIIGENTVVEAGAKVGTEPDGSENWSVATCGPDITIRSGAVVPAAAMIYTGEEV